MRRLAAALVVLAAVTAVPGPTLSAFTSSVSNSSSIGSNSTFVPINTTAPTITGAVAALGTLSLQAPGAWRSNVSVSRTYQWQVCTSLLVSTCVDIPGATGVSYLLGAVPLGSFFRVVETATNTYGSASTASAIDS